MSAETDTLAETEPSPEIADAAMRAAFDKALPADAKIEGEEGDDVASDGTATEVAARKAAAATKSKTTLPSKKPQADDEEDESEDDDEAQASDSDDDPDEESDEESDEDEDETGDGSSTPYENALKLLKIKHFTADDLKGLSKARVVEIAARIRKDEAIVTQKLQAQAAAKKASDKAATRPDAEDRSQQPAAPKGLRENATRLKQLFGDDETSAIIEPLEWAYSQAQEAMTMMQANLESKLAEMQEQIEETATRNAAVVRENLRLRLQRKFPEHAEALEDERASGRVFKKMAALNASGDYKDNLDGLAADAMSLVFKEQVKKKQSLLAKTSGGHRLDGQRNGGAKPEADLDATMRGIFNVALDPDLSPGQRQKRLNRLSQ